MKYKDNRSLFNYLLTVMALDNEYETILDECESKLPDKDLEFLFEKGIKHMQSEARWQIAELIGRKNKNLLHRLFMY